MSHYSPWRPWEAEARFERTFGIAEDTRTDVPPSLAHNISSYPQQATPQMTPMQQDEDELECWDEGQPRNSFIDEERGINHGRAAYEDAVDQDLAQGDTAANFSSALEDLFTYNSPPHQGLYTHNTTTHQDQSAFTGPKPQDHFGHIDEDTPGPFLNESPARRHMGQAIPSMTSTHLSSSTNPQHQSPPTSHTTQHTYLAQPMIPPALMAPLTQPLQAMPAPAISFLQVRKGRMGVSNATGNSFGRFQQDRPPYNVQPPLGVDIGMREMCVFLPDWLHIVEVIVRLMRNGATRATLAKMQLLATGELTKENFTRCKNKIQQQFGESGRLHYGADTWTIKLPRSEGAEDDLTAGHWNTHRKGKDVIFQHIKLVDIYSTVPIGNFPTGSDRLLFTQCLEFARNNPGLDLDTSHYNWIIQSQGLQAPSAPANKNRDQEAVEAFDEPDP